MSWLNLSSDTASAYTKVLETSICRRRWEADGSGALWASPVAVGGGRLESPCTRLLCALVGGLERAGWHIERFSYVY